MTKRGGKSDGNNQKLAELRAALASDGDPLAQFRELMPEGSPEQNVVVYVFAAVLDTNSEGLPILLDRYDSDELDAICAGLQMVGATETLTDLVALRKAQTDALKSGGGPLDASEQVYESEIGQAVSKKHEFHIADMESNLLKYCRDNVEILALE